MNIIWLEQLYRRFFIRDFLPITLVFNELLGVKCDIYGNGLSPSVA